jgi:hypothetical protein
MTFIKREWKQRGGVKAIIWGTIQEMTGVYKRFLPRARSKILRHNELKRMVFGQHNVNTQQFFLDKYGEYHSVTLPQFPHYLLLKELLENPFHENIYSEYLRASWEYRYGAEVNTDENRKRQIKKFLDLYWDIAEKKHLNSKAIKYPVTVCPRPDGHFIIVDGNHRASIALKLGLDLKVSFIKPSKYFRDIATIPEEFYGSARLNMPYQSVFHGEEKLLEGRRPDILERMKLIDGEDLNGKTVLDLGCNIGASCFLAAHFGASRVYGVDFSPNLISAAVRLNAYFATPSVFIVHDLNTALDSVPVCDTVFCFSLVDHLSTNEGITQTILERTGRVLYFEGHANTTLKDYKYLLNGDNFADIKQIGYLRDGVHTKRASRPFLRCEIAGGRAV